MHPAHPAFAASSTLRPVSAAPHLSSRSVVRLPASRFPATASPAPARRRVVRATQTTPPLSAAAAAASSAPAPRKAKKSGTPSSSGKVVVLGLSHHTATVDVRERLAVPEAEWQSAAASLCTLSSVDEAAVLSTCNRFEVYLVSDTPFAAIQQAVAHLSSQSHIAVAQLRKHLFMLTEDEAAWHLLRVSAGLDSLVVGEGQILAQVKKCYELATQPKVGQAGKILSRLLNCAVSAGKRVRSETGIAQGAVSISSAAVELAEMKLEDSFGPNTNVCIVGAGKMSRLLVQHLLSKDVTNITIVNRTEARARELVAMFDVCSTPSLSAPCTDASEQAAPPHEEEVEEESKYNFTIDLMPSMLRHVANADVIFTSTAADQPLLTRDVLTGAGITESGRDHAVIDISVPRNVSDDVNDVPNVRAYNVDDLKAVVARNQARRRRLTLDAERVLREEQMTFNNWHSSLGCIPAISKLQQRAEQIRTDEVEKVKGKLGDLTPGQRKAVEALSKGIINKMLHSPMVHLRGLDDTEERTSTLRHIEALFKL